MFDLFVINKAIMTNLEYYSPHCTAVLLSPELLEIIGLFEGRLTDGSWEYVADDTGRVVHCAIPIVFLFNVCHFCFAPTFYCLLSGVKKFIIHPDDILRTFYFDN